MNTPQKSTHTHKRKRRAESAYEGLKLQPAESGQILEAHETFAPLVDGVANGFHYERHFANTEPGHTQNPIRLGDLDGNDTVESVIELPALFIDSNLCVSRITPAVNRLAPQEYIGSGRRIDELPLEYLGAELAADTQKALFGNAVVSREVLCNGTWYERRIFPYYRPGERLRGATVTYTDFSPRRRAEAQARAKAHALALANEELEAFVYSVSHDLRNPLHAVISCVEAIRSSPASTDEVCREALEHIDQSARRMSQVISDLLVLSHITHKEIRRERVDLTAMAESFVNELRRAAPGRSVRFLAARNLVAMADAGLVRIALENLIRNAWKFSSKREDAVIELGVSDAGDPPTFYIRDNGAGFDCGAAEGLFKPFARFHCDEEFKGTGIGLATVKRIVDKHGGAVWAEGEVGKGATVYFRLS